MSTGVEMLIKSVLKSMNINPEDLLQSTQGAVQFAMGVEARLNRMESKLDRILKFVEENTDDEIEPAGEGHAVSSALMLGLDAGGVTIDDLNKMLPDKVA